MPVSFDDSELRTLAADLIAAGDAIDGKILPVIKKGALNIKNQMRDEMSKSSAFKGAARDISFDVHGGDFFGVGVIEAEIGPKSGPGNRGALANIAYFGGSNGGGGTVADPKGALDAEMPNFTRAVEKILEATL